MTTLSDRVLSAAELRALQTRSNARGATRLAIHLALLGGTGWLVAIASGWTLLPAVLALGLVQVALFAPAHETMHQTAFASRRANAIVGWLVSCPSLLNAQFYTSFHLAHHRHTQIAGQDPELDAPPTRTTCAGYASRVLGVRVLVAAAARDRGLLARRSAPLSLCQRRRRAARDPQRAGDDSAAGRRRDRRPRCCSAGRRRCSTGSVRNCLASPFLRAYLLAEHTGCTLDRNGLTNTRTTLTTAPVRLLMWNMPYHAEHHLFPSIPFHRLAEAHAPSATGWASCSPATCAGTSRWSKTSPASRERACPGRLTRRSSPRVRGNRVGTLPSQHAAPLPATLIAKAYSAAPSSTTNPNAGASRRRPRARILITQPTPAQGGPVAPAKDRPGGRHPGGIGGMIDISGGNSFARLARPNISRIKRM